MRLRMPLAAATREDLEELFGTHSDRGTGRTGLDAGRPFFARAAHVALHRFLGAAFRIVVQVAARRGTASEQHPLPEARRLLRLDAHLDHAVRAVALAVAAADAGALDEHLAV